MKTNASFQLKPNFVAGRLRILARCKGCGASFVGNSDAIQAWQDEHFCAPVDVRNPYSHFRNSLWIPTLLRDSMDVGAADFGTMQLFDSESRVLRVQASRGFGREFLDYFQAVAGSDCACGAALQNRSPVVVTDVLADPNFGEQSRAILLRWDVRSVVATPLLDRSRNLVGVLAVHSRRPQHFSGARLKNINGLIGEFGL